MNQLSQKNTIPKSRPRGSLLGRRQTNLRPEEIQALTEPLLELLPQAALLIDLEEEKILHSNTAALRLSAYSRQELATQNLDELFPAERHPNSVHFLDFGVSELIKPFRCHMVLRGGNSLPVEIQAVIMDTHAQSNVLPAPNKNGAFKLPRQAPRYLVLHIEPSLAVERRQQALTRRERHKENLASLTASLAEVFRSVDEAGKKRAMQVALSHIASLSGLEALAVYWWEAGSGGVPYNPAAIPCLAVWPGKENPSFPETLSLAEIQAVRTPTAWTKGKRLTYSIQQHLRSAGFGFSKLIPLNPMLAAPLGRSSATPAILAGAVATANIQIAGLLVGAASASLEEESLTSLQMASGLVAQVLMFSARQSALQNALARISESNALTDYVKDALFDCTLLLDPDLRILDANQAALDALEYKRHEVIGKEIGQILITDQSFVPSLEGSRSSGSGTTDGQELLLEQMRAALRQSGPSQPQQIKIYRRTGTSFLANYRLVPVNRINPQSGLMLILQDLSELEYFRKENEQLNQRAYLGEITSSFAHEIRNPINSLSSGIQLLLTSVPYDFPDRPVLENLEIDCERLTRIVDSGLAFFRKKEYKMELVRVDRLVNRLQNSAWQHRLHRYRTKLEVLISGELPSVNADEHALEHVFTNLFDNAVDAMSENPPNQPRNIIFKLSTVQNEHNQEMLEIWISDTGPGIPDSLVERIFDPFFTTKTKGTGVGLSIVRRIISAHGGTIAIIHNVGGTTFRVRLPVPRRISDTGGITTITD
jgi:signal transduction histidine kinase